MNQQYTKVNLILLLEAYCWHKSKTDEALGQNSEKLHKSFQNQIACFQFLPIFNSSWKNTLTANPCLQLTTNTTEQHLWTKLQQSYFRSLCLYGELILLLKMVLSGRWISIRDYRQIPLLILGEFKIILTSFSHGNFHNFIQFSNFRVIENDLEISDFRGDRS